VAEKEEQWEHSIKEDLQTNREIHSIFGVSDNDWVWWCLAWRENPDSHLPRLNGQTGY